MDAFDLVALILGAAALLSVFNARALRLPETIGLMASGLLASGLVLATGAIFPDQIDGLCQKVLAFDFSFFVLTVAIGFLIFAGALGADSKAMAADRWPILMFATFGIFLSTVLVGALAFAALKLLGLDTPFIHCLLFGALISPTDPIAVLAILKSTAVPESLQADIAGESLLNDGVAVVAFLTVLQIAEGGHGEGAAADGGFHWGSTLILFAREVAGGGLLGAAFAAVAIFLMRQAKTPPIDALVSVALVTGCVSAADALHVSGPLALVVAGLAVGRWIIGRSVDVSERAHLLQFWDAIDHLLNAVLFTLMGFVLLGVSEEFDPRFFAAALFAIPIALAARVGSVGVSMLFTKLRRRHPAKTMAILSWGGLRGGISIALALTLAPELSRDLIIHMTYGVVVFSILVQGLSVGPLVKRLQLA